MSQPIRVKVNVKKILKEHLFEGKSGTYLDLYLYPTPGDTYGNDFRVTQDLPKEARDAGVRGEILGNAKFVGAKPTAQPPSARVAHRPAPAAKRPPADPDLDGPEDDIPF